MANKRENGGGTFDKRPNGSWCYRVVIGYDSDGKTQRKAFYGKSKVECKAKADQFRADTKKGEAIYKNMALGAWGIEWLETYKKDTVAPHTYTGYEYLMRHITESSIGRMPLTDVKPVHVKKFLSGKKNTSHSTITKLKAFLYAIFECGIDNDLCIKNPARNVKPPSVAQGEKDAFTDLEISTILEYAATEEGKWFKLAINTLLYTGLRRGELLGLMWDDIDLNNSVLRLRRSVAFGEGREIMTVTSNSRKNHSRDIPLTIELHALFKDEKARKDRPKSLYIFTSSVGGLIKPDNFGRTYQKFFRHLNAWCKATEKPTVRELTMHECRHTFASLLLRHGVDSRIRQALLGHADEDMTNNYTHTDLDMLKKAMEKIG